MTKNEFTDRKVLVVGLGVSGYAAAELLAEKGARVKVTESAGRDEVKERLDKISSLPIEVETGGHTKDFCSGADLIVTSPGVDPGAAPLVLAKEEGVPVIGELELGWMSARGTMIAVTGTNGKSTTTELIGRILSSAGKHAVVCGNIGNPLSGEVRHLTDESVAVVEVSSFQLDTIKYFRPHVAVLLNITGDHYERHGDMQSYRASKFRIFLNQTEDDWAVLNSSFSGEEELEFIRSRTVFFGRGKCDVRVEGDSVVDSSGTLVTSGELKMKGVHNLENAACASLVGRIMGAGPDRIRGALTSFEPLDHRFETVASFGGVEFIDDSKATNIDATARALESVDGKVVLIAGGRDKGGDYRSILPVVKEKVDAVVVIGEAAEKIREAFSGNVAVMKAGTMRDAVEKASHLARGKAAVMLSPMCSSFDMYSSYKERGDDFKCAVLSLVASGRK